MVAVHTSLHRNVHSQGPCQSPGCKTVATAYLQILSCMFTIVKFCKCAKHNISKTRSFSQTSCLFGANKKNCLFMTGSLYRRFPRWTVSKILSCTSFCRHELGTCLGHLDKHFLHILRTDASKNTMYIMYI